MSTRSATPDPSCRVAAPAVVLLLALVASVGCGALGRRIDVPTCTPRFATVDGWLGGDGVYSVPLPDRAAGERRTLWLFGDTYVADPANPPREDRVGAAFIHNSIAVSSCRGDAFEIDYVWRHDDEGRPRAFFESAEPDRSWYWLFDGFVHAGALYVGLLEVTAGPPDGPLGMPFALTGMALARIDDPGAPPTSWRPRIMTLSRSHEAFPGSAMRIEGDHVLLFGFAAMRDGHQPRLLARLPLAALARDPDDLEPFLETWTREGVWQAGWLPEQAEILMADNASEMSVEAHGEGRTGAGLLALYASPLQTDGDGRSPASRSNGVYARHAPAATGPWSERRRVYSMPEASDPDGGTICYAAKEHPAFARPGELLFTYVCNVIALPGQDPWDALGRLERDMELYVPRVIRIPEPGWSAQGTGDRSVGSRH